MTTYHVLSQFAQTGGLIYFMLLFAAVAIYALRPRNSAKFERAARLPLAED